MGTLCALVRENITLDILQKSLEQNVVMKMLFSSLFTFKKHLKSYKHKLATSQRVCIHV